MIRSFFLPLNVYEPIKPKLLRYPKLSALPLKDPKLFYFFNVCCNIMLSFLVRNVKLIILIDLSQYPCQNSLIILW